MSVKYVGSIDQGTTSTRFILFDHAGTPCFSFQKEHKQIYPKPGWVEHNPIEILENTVECIRETLKQASIEDPKEEIAAVGITNQRETVIASKPENRMPMLSSGRICAVRILSTKLWPPAVNTVFSKKRD